MPTPIAQPAPSPLHGSSASRLQSVCPSCGFQNLEVDLRCQKCGRRLPPVDFIGPAQQSTTKPPDALYSPAALPEPAPAIVPARPALPDHVKYEIHSRVERFKARRRGQTLPLPFVEPVLAEEEKLVPFPTLENETIPKISRPRPSRNVLTPTSVAEAMPAGPAPTLPVGQAGPAPSADQPDPFEAHLRQRETIEPPAAPVDLTVQVPLFVPPSEQVQPQWQCFHIATLQRRLQGIGSDLGHLLIGLLLFAAPIYWIVGRPHFNLRLLVAFAAGSLLVALLYGVLFVAVFGETPGMTAAGLRIVSFSGRPATIQQRILRVAGAMVSSGSFLLGYLWAFVDEERLYWHDHISKTVLTDSID